jgi:Zincin-like metallopeptidase
VSRASYASLVRSATGRGRDRRGRGVRGPLAPKAVPLHRSPGERFDDLVLDAVDEVHEHWAPELSGVEFAVEDVPPPGLDDLTEDVLLDRGVPLGQLRRGGVEGVAAPLIVVFRRPIETRALEALDRPDLVFMVVAELAALYLGRDVDEIDPPD